MQRLALAIAVALLAAAAARAVQSGYRQRLEALQAEAEAQRKKLGLDADRAKLYAQYPTPEVTFESDLTPVGCGQSAQVTIEGRFSKRTAFVIRRDDVQALSDKLSATGWQARLRAAPDALPGPIEVAAIAPVSGASSQRRIAEVRGRLELTLEFEDGWKAHLVPVQEGAHEAQWSKGEAKRSSSANVTPEENGLRVIFAQSEEQTALAQEQAKELTGEIVNKELQAAMARLQECGKLPEPEQLPCIQRTQPELEKASLASKNRVEETTARYQQRAPKDAWACSQVELRGPLGKMEGKAECARPLKVAARVSCTPPAPE
jgi:hypothetical protein